MKNKIYLFLFYLLIIAGCSSTEKSTRTEIPEPKIVKKFINQVKLEIEKNNCWIDLMPGSESKFHVSGKLILLPDTDYDFKITNLKFIKVHQNGKQLYYINPKVIEEASNSKKELTFSTLKGLSVTPDLSTRNPVVFELVFNADGNELKYFINNVKVEEVL